MVLEYKGVCYSKIRFYIESYFVGIHTVLSIQFYRNLTDNLFIICSTVEDFMNTKKIWIPVLYFRVMVPNSYLLIQ